MAEETARDIARKWWKAKIESGEDFALPVAAKAAAQELRNKPGFAESFVDDFIERVLHDLGQNMMAAARAANRTQSGLREQIARDTTEEVRSRWQKWMQFYPAGQVHMPLVNMNRQQLLDAAAFTEDQAAEIAFEAKWLRLLASKLKGDQAVGDVLSDSDLDELRKSIQPVVTPIREAA